MANGVYPKKLQVLASIYLWGARQLCVQDVYNSASSPCSFFLILHVEALLQPCTESQGTSFSLLVPCNLLPLRWQSPSHGCLSVTQVTCSTHTSIAALSLRCELCARNARVRQATYRALLAEVTDALVSQHSRGQGHRSEHWNKNLPRKKIIWKCPVFIPQRQITAHRLASLQRLKDPGQLRICWKKTRHSGEGIKHFRLECLTPENTAIEKYASLAAGHCKRGQVKTEMCPCLYKRGILKCFLPLLSHACFLFPLWSTQSSCLISNNLNQLQMFASDNIFMLHTFPVRTCRLSHHSYSY